MPALVAGIHVLLRRSKDVDGRDKPGHDGGGLSQRVRPEVADPMTGSAKPAVQRSGVLDGFRFAQPILKVERSPLPRNVHGKDGNDRRAGDDSQSIFCRVGRIKPARHESNAPNDDRGEQQKGDRRCASLHGQDQDPGRGIQHADQRRQVRRRVKRRGFDPEEIMREGRGHFRQSKRDHQQPDDGDADRTRPEHFHVRRARL